MISKNPQTPESHDPPDRQAGDPEKTNSTSPYLADTLQFRWAPPGSTFVYGWISVIAFAIALIVPLSSWHPHEALDRLIVTLIPTILGVATAARCLILQRRKKHALAQLRKPPSPKDNQSEIFANLMHYRQIHRHTGAKGYQPTQAQIIEECTKRKWTLPRIIIDQRYAKQVGEIEISPELLEPERVTGTAFFTGFTGWIYVVSMISWLVLGGQWFANSLASTLVMLVFVAGIVYLCTLFRQGTTGRSPLNFGTAGLGIIEFTNGETIQAADCITLIYRKIYYLQVLLLAPNDQVIDLQFANPKDPGFITFWQRWNHPNPRPELLTTPNSPKTYSTPTA